MKLTYLFANCCSQPSGFSDRVSAQSVSMIPSAGCSTARTKPFLAQKSFNVVQAASGLALTTSQRSLPARATRASGLGGNTSLGRGAARAATAPEAVAA